MPDGPTIGAADGGRHGLPGDAARAHELPVASARLPTGSPDRRSGSHRGCVRERTEGEWPFVACRSGIRGARPRASKRTVVAPWRPARPPGGRRPAKPAGRERVPAPPDRRLKRGRYESWPASPRRRSMRSTSARTSLCFCRTTSPRAPRRRPQLRGTRGPARSRNAWRSARTSSYCGPVSRTRPLQPRGSHSQEKTSCSPRAARSGFPPTASCSFPARNSTSTSAIRSSGVGIAGLLPAARRRTASAILPTADRPARRAAARHAAHTPQARQAHDGAGRRLAAHRPARGPA